VKVNIWVFPKIVGNPQNGWFIMENSIKMDDLEVPLFLETPIYTNLGGFREGMPFNSPNPSRRPLQRLRLMAAVEVNFDDASCIDFMAF